MHRKLTGGVVAAFIGVLASSAEAGTLGRTPSVTLAAAGGAADCNLMPQGLLRDRCHFLQAGEREERERRAREREKREREEQLIDSAGNPCVKNSRGHYSSAECREKDRARREEREARARAERQKQRNNGARGSAER